MDKTKALIKRIKSYSKKDWDFDDYPTKVWKHPNFGNNNKVTYGASIVNWGLMTGHGETPEKALAALKDKFRLHKDKHGKSPRPGKKVPLKIEFASTENIDKYEKTAVDFFKKVLDMDYSDGFFSDDSLLAYFEPHFCDEAIRKEAREEIINRTLSLYNVDISDIYDKPLWSVLERINSIRTNSI
jgi:predicted RNase H-like HicB family nuclease